jgi:flagellar biosynthesis chaperone FliJ
MRPIDRDTFPLLKAAYPQFNWNRHTSRVATFLEVYEELTKDQSELARMGWTKIDIQRNVYGSCSWLNIHCDPTWKRRYSELSVVAELAIDRLERKVEGLPNLTPSCQHTEQIVTILISTPQRYSKLLESLLKSALTYDSLVPVENYSTTIDYAFFETVKADQLRQLAEQLQAPVEPLFLILS